VTNNCLDISRRGQEKQFIHQQKKGDIVTYSSNIKLPNAAEYIIASLEKRGFEAYAVGGCVRDSVMGKKPKDWDICTEALPEQTMQCFAGQRIIETGLKHGTVSLLLNNEAYEVTTFRADGIYKDNRRPETVEFIKDIKGDLARRDFTINALAYNPEKGIQDPFGGMADIKGKTIRCVGDAEKRFGEDALRIMRALRFASVLEFEIEAATAAAVKKKCGLLRCIAAERVSAELGALLIGGGVGSVLLSYSSVIEAIIPEISETIGFVQKSKYHDLDVWEHTVRSVTYATEDILLRLAMLLHDIAKPLCFTEVDGIGHFRGHPQKSAEMAKGILSRLKYDKETIGAVVELILHHGKDVEPAHKPVKRWLNLLGEVRLRQLLEIKRADTMAKAAPFRQGQIEQIDAALSVLNEVIRQRQCFSIKGLEVSGRDLIAIGIPQGPDIGKVLGRLLEMVIDEEIENDRTKLLKKVKFDLRLDADCDTIHPIIKNGRGTKV